MLNELLVIERGVRQANIDVGQRHPDVKDAGKKSALLVQLNENGQVVRVQVLQHGVTPWTIRNGQHNSFPYVQLSYPLWYREDGEKWRETVLTKKGAERRIELLSLATTARYNADAFANWPGDGLVKGLRKRSKQLESLMNTDGAVVEATIVRFLIACSQSPQQLIEDVTKFLLANLDQTAQNDWVDVAVSLLVGKNIKNVWKCDGALLFEASGFPLSITDPKLVPLVSQGLQSHITDAGNNTSGICGLTGSHEQLLSGTFHQPKLPVLGQTYLFAKNSEIPANDRYGRLGSDSMPVGQGTADRLDAAIRALTSDDRKNITWRAIPGEAPKQSDLLLAFVEAIPDAPVAGALAEDDFSDEASKTASDVSDSIASYEKRTERMIVMVKARIGSDITKTPVQIMIFRKVDPANRKVTYADTITVDGLYQAAIDWTKGERNLPPWVMLPVLMKGESKLRLMPPPHIAPFGLISFTKQLFIRGGTERQEVIGIPASEALRLFLAPANLAHHRSHHMLQLVLTRRSKLLLGVAHAIHTPECGKQRSENIKKFDSNEALRTITVLGELLYKLSREKEVYMDETAFKLGQLLAVADVVHAGYCADVRSGAIPPALLGNQVFTMAQSAPAKALAILGRRWKPYDGWAKRVGRELIRIEKMIESNNKDEQQRGWDIRIAISQARRMGLIATDIAPSLENCHVDDVFRAELLLGYIAGLPNSHQEDI